MPHDAPLADALAKKSEARVLEEVALLEEATADPVEDADDWDVTRLVGGKENRIVEMTGRTEATVCGVSLIAAPVVLGLATFFWSGPNVGPHGGTIQVYAYLFWIPGLFGLLSLLRPRMPRFAAWGMLLASLGCIGGIDWALDGIYTHVIATMAQGEVQREAVMEAMGIAAPFVLFLPGAASR